MSTRREFLWQTSAAGAVLATSIHVAPASEDVAAGSKTPVHTRRSHATVSRIAAVIRREDTLLRYDFSGDNWHMSWANDDRQLVSLCDGFGCSETPKGMHNSRLFSITGGPREAKFNDVHGYPELMPLAEKNTPRYYGFGTLALDGRIYQFLSTFNHALLRPDGSSWPDLRFVGAKLIYSPDNGRSWCNQDGSTPVIWEAWDRRSRESMVFLDEDQDAFSLLTVLQMGKNYEHNRDGYIYIYAPNGNTDGTMNELVLLRVPKERLLDRGSYEYFSGMRTDGTAMWTKEIAARGIVHAFPRGWVSRLGHPYGWLPSVVFNAPLNMYMMANSGIGIASDGMWFAKPSYIGFWTAPNPWGPWTQVHEETAWMPGNDPAARAYNPQIAPKWIAADGKSFWLVWTDFQFKDSGAFEHLYNEFKEKSLRNELTGSDWVERAVSLRKYMPYYAFNAQRVDLTVA